MIYCASSNIDMNNALFTTANIDSGYLSFESTHVCNEYCRYFNLPTDWKNMAYWKDSTERGSTVGMERQTVSDMDLGTQPQIMTQIN